MRKRKNKWLEKVSRRERTNISRQALKWNPKVARRGGRPQKIWRRTVEEELREESDT